MNYGNKKDVIRSLLTLNELELEGDKKGFFYFVETPTGDTYPPYPITSTKGVPRAICGFCYAAIGELAEPLSISSLVQTHLTPVGKAGRVKCKNYDIFKEKRDALLKKEEKEKKKKRQQSDTSAKKRNARQEESDNEDSSSSSSSSSSDGEEEPKAKKKKSNKKPNTKKPAAVTKGKNEIETTKFVAPISTKTKKPCKNCEKYGKLCRFHQEK